MSARQQLRVALIQSSLVWENPEANLAHFAEKILEAGPVDLILLPEMFTTGFSMHTALAEEFPGITVEWLKIQAEKSDAAICTSMMSRENGKNYNRLAFVRPDGSYQTYDKRHLFTLAGEQTHYTAGHQRLVLDYKGWKICPLICYDLRFPVWCRNTEEFDLQLFVANWPERRSAQWEMLLRARAIENQCFVLGCNRVGADGNDVYHDGRSLIANYIGETLAFAQHDETTLRATLSHEELKDFRQKFAFLNDRDGFEIKM